MKAKVIAEIQVDKKFCDPDCIYNQNGLFCGLFQISIYSLHKRNRPCTLDENSSIILKEIK